MLAALWAPVVAAEPPTGSAAPGLSEAQREERLQRVRALRTEAAELERRAEAYLNEQNVACHRKFFVASCLDDARRQRADAKIGANRLEAQARALELAVRAAERAENDARRALEIKEREVRAARNREEHQQRLRGLAERDANRAQRRAEREAKRNASEPQAPADTAPGAR